MSTSTLTDRSNAVQPTTDFNDTISINVGTGSPIYVEPDTIRGSRVVAFNIDADTAFNLPAHIAIALGAAAQSVGLHVLEEEPREIRRNTEPGAPSHEEGVL